MKKLYVLVCMISVLILIFSCGQQKQEAGKTEKSDTVTTVKPVVVQTPNEAIKELKDGNKRFIEGKLINTEYKKEIGQTKNGQKPHSVILSCMDSRVPPEIIFDQGIGNIFVIRVAGNIEDENVLGSLEYGVGHVGAKLIVVMGHRHCGAVTGAVENMKLGKLTQLLDQIKPAIKSNLDSPDIVDETAKNSVKITMDDIMNKSSIIRKLIDEKKVIMIGAFYDVETGVVTFME
jgi:carbonic anhydrase